MTPEPTVREQVIAGCGLLLVWAFVWFCAGVL